MKIQNVNLNLFRTKNVEQSQNSNAFAINNVSNPFAGKLSSDIFQSSSIDNNQPNYFAIKAAELVTGWNRGIENIKNISKELIAPAIAFAGKIKAGYEKVNSINIEDVFSNLKNEISLLALNKDVRKYLKMSVPELSEELAKELAA